MNRAGRLIVEYEYYVEITFYILLCCANLQENP